MFVVGTAGHVDHGKSTLVRALTGIDPDRLQEEKAREMTIDLGFAWLTLPSGREVSVVDVPGHERFIKNMLAGVGGIDAAVLVIAADEGVMPQTVEHLTILDLLGVSRGVVALTKRDMVDDEWLELVREETVERLRGSGLSNAPIVEVSARAGTGLEELVSVLDDILSRAEARPGTGMARLPVDRVFSVQGFGTIVTGTLIDGPLHVGQDLEVLPGKLRTRVRGLQTHKHKVESANAGRRLAINLAAVAVEDLKRGDVLAPVASLSPTSRFDARIQLTGDAPEPLANGKKLDLFVGAAETPVIVGLLDRDELLPGESGYAQLRTQQPLVLLREDRFILRRPSPSRTVGGGIVLDAHPRRHKRHTEATLQVMETLERGRPEDLVLAALTRSGPTDRASLLDIVGQGAAPALDTLRESGKIHVAGESAGKGTTPLLFTDGQWRILTDKVCETLAAHHKAHPLRGGIPKEELRSRLRLGPRVYAALLAAMVERALVVDSGSVVRLAGFEVQLEGPTAREAERVIALIERGGNTPPGVAELEVEPELLAALVEARRLVKLNDSVVYTPETYDRLVAEILRKLDEAGTITVAETRDMFGLSRKYSLALLEHLDAIKVTRRQGDERVRR